MGGLIKDFAVTALIIILNHWVYAVEDTIAYELVVNFITRNETLILAVGILVSGCLPIFSSMFESLGLYKITYALSKILVRVSQFLITFLAILNLFFYAAMKNNLMHDKGYLMLFVLLLILGSSCWALRIIDFNYDTKNAVVPVAAIAIMSVVIVEFIWPIYRF